MDYGKFKYERDIRQKEARKKQSRVEVKEIKFRPKIDPHDYATKKGHVIRFLKAGARVKVTIMFRGREMAHTELGKRKLDQLTADIQELGTVEVFPKLDGRNMTMVLAPTKRPQVRENREEERHHPAAREATGEARSDPQAEPGPQGPPAAPAPAMAPGLASGPAAARSPGIVA